MLLPIEEGCKAEEDKKLCELARLKWVNTFGPPRLSAPRVLTGSGKRKQSTFSAAAFLKRRRTCVSNQTQEHMSNVDGLLCETQSENQVGVNGWTAEHAREQAFQEAKRQQRLLQALSNSSQINLQKHCLFKSFGGLDTFVVWQG